MRRTPEPILKFFSRGARGGAALRVSLVASSLFLLFLLSAPEAAATTFTVNSNTNVSDQNPGDGLCRSSNATGRVCTLRAAIEETNALAAGAPHRINFAITTVDGRGVAVITVTGSALPNITSAGLTIDGTTQNNANGGQMGAGALGTTVGTNPAVTLTAVNRPDVEIVDGGSNFATGLNVQAAGVTIRGLCIYGFGATANAPGNANILIGNFTGTIIEQNVLGTTANNFADPLAPARSIGDNIRTSNGDSGTIRNNLIGYSNGKGIQLGDGATGWTVSGNEVRGNGIDNANLDGIDIENGSGSNTITANLFWENEACGVDMYHSTGSNIIRSNTVRRNGIGPNAGVVETPGIRLYGTNNLVERNIIDTNYGPGIGVTTANGNSTGNRITQNSMFANGTIPPKGGGAVSNHIGIDLHRTTDNERLGTTPYVNVNDAGDTDAGGNNLQNFPVLSAAILSGSNLTVSGFARPGVTIELFVAAPDPTGFGEGQTYLVTLTEGSAADADTGTGTYGPGLVNGLNVGTDTTNRFRFTIAAPAGVAAGTVLTSTATFANNTSEFSGNVTVAPAPLIDLCKTFPGQTCIPPEPQLPEQQPGSDITYVIHFTNIGGSPASTFSLVDALPAETDFKVGSINTTLGSLSGVTTEYSTDGTNWSTTLPPPAGGEPPGYNRNVRHLRWTFNGQLNVNSTGNVTFIVRIR